MSWSALVMARSGHGGPATRRRGVGGGVPAPQFAPPRTRAARSTRASAAPTAGASLVVHGHVRRPCVSKEGTARVVAAAVSRGGHQGTVAPEDCKFSFPGRRNSFLRTRPVLGIGFTLIRCCPDCAKVAEKLSEFIHKVESQGDSESPPITLVTQMLHTLPGQRPSAMEVLQHFWLAPPLFGMDTPVPMQPMYQVAPLNEAPWLSSGGHPPGSHPKRLVSEVAPMKEPPLPSSGGPAQPTSEVAALKEPLLSFLGGRLPEPHPKLSHLTQSAPLRPHLVPGDLPAFIAAVRSLGHHEGNLLLHSILAFSKYPTVLEDLAPRLARLPKQLKAHVGAPSTSAFRECVKRTNSSAGSSSSQALVCQIEKSSPETLRPVRDKSSPVAKGLVSQIKKLGRSRVCLPSCGYVF